MSVGPILEWYFFPNEAKAPNSFLLPKTPSRCISMNSAVNISARSREYITMALLSFLRAPLGVRLYEPVHTNAPSTTANLWCMRAGPLSVTTGMPA